MVNFCPIPLCPTLNINKSMERFERDLHIRSVFAGSEDLIPLANVNIYIRSKCWILMYFWSALLFVFSLFPCVPLLASPDFWDCPLEGLRRMLFWPCADQDADFWGGLDLVFVWVVDVLFFLEARPLPLVPFWGWLSWHYISSTFLQFFDLLFILLGLLGHRDCDWLGELHGCFLCSLGDFMALLECWHSVIKLVELIF